MTTEEFINKFRSEDTRRLALQGSRYPEVNMPYALDQIEGWQTARTKLPSWVSCEGIIYPPHLSMEQCSSEQTARYKSLIAPKGGNIRMIDLTGGFGVDFSFIARGFAEATYVDRLPYLCEIASHNFEVLGLKHANVVCGDGIEYLHSMKPLDFIYLDPARRDSNGCRTYALEDCTPNILELENALLEKAPVVMVKLSPMLDWHKLVEDLGSVSELHIISVKNECKEMLAILKRESKEPLRIYAVNDDETIAFCEIGDAKASLNLWDEDGQNLSGKYLYEPNASVMKTGCFGLLCQRYGVKKIGKNSNLFISDESVKFPGRKFQISAVSSMNKKDLKRKIAGMNKANIAVRNFPMTADSLRKQLKLKDGGDVYLFGTTLGNNKHILLITNKA